MFTVKARHQNLTHFDTVSASHTHLTHFFRRKGGRVQDLVVGKIDFLHLFGELLFWSNR